jgi:hypothetical protein
MAALIMRCLARNRSLLLSLSADRCPLHGSLLARPRLHNLKIARYLGHMFSAQLHTAALDATSRELETENDLLEGQNGALEQRLAAVERAIGRAE